MKFVAVVSTLLIASASAFAPASTSEVCVNFSIFNFQSKCRHVERMEAKKKRLSREARKDLGCPTRPSVLLYHLQYFDLKNEQISPHTNVISFFYI